jgi:hypothetical protein
MAEIRKPKAAARSAAARKAGRPVTTEIVVRRGALRRYDALTRKTADLPVVVTWDRRQADRRASQEPGPVERRERDRRQKPPFTWELAEFVVVAPRPPLPAVKPASAKSKASSGRTRR